jgi:oxygen-independent coproporphyrinogen-3 oxidase
LSGLYLHIPFCLRKCPYCDFFSQVSNQDNIQQYVSLLTSHIKQAACKGWAHPVETIYFGGGTPSLLTPQQVALILNSIQQNFSVSSNVEVSLEANPGTVSLESLTGYHSAGVNRLSLGLQSCCDKQLKQLGRLHSNDESREAITWVRKAGFDNLSLDLMFALPGQNHKELNDEINNFLDFQPDHFSCYGLTAEPGTPLHNQVEQRELILPEEDFYADAFMLIHSRLTEAGYEHYEIANYGKKDFACRHNLNYWQRQPYLGIGAGAHSFFADEWGSRWQVPADLNRFRETVENDTEPMQCLESFTRDSALRETIYLALRTRRGVDDTTLSEEFGTTLEESFPEAINQSSSWLVQHNGRWSFSTEGWLLFDHLILPFL